MTASWDAECVAWRCLGPCLQATESERDSGLQVLRGAETRGGRSPDATVQRERERESERERETESQTRGLLPPLAPSKAKSEASRGVGLRARGFRPSYPTKRQRERERESCQAAPSRHFERMGLALQRKGWGRSTERGVGTAHPASPRAKQRERAGHFGSSVRTFVLGAVHPSWHWGAGTGLT